MKVVSPWRTRANPLLAPGRQGRRPWRGKLRSVPASVSCLVPVRGISSRSGGEGGVQRGGPPLCPSHPVRLVWGPCPCRAVRCRGSETAAPLSRHHQTVLMLFLRGPPSPCPHCVPTSPTSCLRSPPVMGVGPAPSAISDSFLVGSPRRLADKRKDAPAPQSGESSVSIREPRVPLRKGHPNLSQWSCFPPELALAVSARLLCLGGQCPSQRSPIPPA